MRGGRLARDRKGPIGAWVEGGVVGDVDWMNMLARFFQELL